jgi:hypothetical protein
MRRSQARRSRSPPQALAAIASAAQPGAELLLEVVQVEHPDAHMYVAVAFYGAELRALQLVWPDDQGHRPWCAAFSNGQVRQPVLGVRFAVA